MTAIHPLPRMIETSLRDVHEIRPAALITSGPAWDALNGALDVPAISRAEPAEADEATFAALAGSIPREAAVIYAVGGGLTVDAAKYAAKLTGLPLVAVPTALSVDAHLTPASGIRRDGCVVYIETGAPDLLYLDWEILSSAPPWLRAAGLGDTLSIATGLWDWRFAEEHGRNFPGQSYISYAAMLAETLLTESLAIAPAAGRGEISALRRLLELLALEVQLCSLLGHSRPEEGSEHLFAYAVENLVGKGLPHGDLVGPGIVGIAAAQQQDPAPLREALLAAGARLDRISISAAEQTLADLPAYAARHALPFGIAHVLGDAGRERALGALTG